MTDEAYFRQFLYRAYFNSVVKDDFQAINEHHLKNKYRTSDMSELELISNIGLLRLSFTKRDKIDTWIDFRDRLKAESDLRSLDTQDLFVGL